jgi:hypothetical protein
MSDNETEGRGFIYNNKPNSQFINQIFGILSSNMFSLKLSPGSLILGVYCILGKRFTIIQHIYEVYI